MPPCLIAPRLLSVLLGPAEAYEPEYEHSIMYVQEYRPSDLLQADNGEGPRRALGVRPQHHRRRLFLARTRGRGLAVPA